MKDPNSIFYYYQKLLSLRSENEVLVYGDYHLLRPDHHQVFAYSRTFGNHKVLVVCNFYDKDTEINLQVTGEKTPKILISNYKDTSKALNDLKLRPYEAVIYRID
jgi:glycosidase